MTVRFDDEMMRVRDEACEMNYLLGFRAADLAQTLRILANADAKSPSRFCNTALAWLRKIT
jgi:hypothetical protein